MRIGQIYDLDLFQTIVNTAYLKSLSPYILTNGQELAIATFFQLPTSQNILWVRKRETSFF